MGLKKYLLSIMEKYKGYGQDLYLFGVKKGSGENIWDIKKHWLLFNSNDDFKK
jgi:molybdate transport system ATP-binding protein